MPSLRSCQPARFRLYHGPMSTKNEAEEWVLGQMELAEPDVSSMLGKLLELANQGEPDAARTLAELAESGLAEKGRVADALRVLRLRADWYPVAEFRKTCADAMQKIVGKSTEKRALLKNCGLDKRIPVTECIDRLERLRALHPGALCFDKTWGFGIVREVDPFGEKVVVDFDRRPEHELSLSYAAETLQLLDEKHILTLRHNDPDGLSRLVREDPAQVVRLAVRSYGPLNAVILQEKLSSGVVAPDQWKTFWAGARKTLKKDPDAVVPTKRTEPILLKEAAEAFDETWFRQLKHDRGIESILAKITDWHTLHGDAPVDPASRAVIENRLAFVIKGADLMGRTVKPRAMMLAHAVTGDDDALGVVDYVTELLEVDNLLELLVSLSAKDMKAFIAFLLSVDRERTLDTLLRLLPRLDVTSLTEVLQTLIREGAEEECRRAIKELVDARRTEVELLSWLSRNMEKLTEWELCGPTEFAEVMLIEMEKDYTGTRLKAQNQLRDRFMQKTWVKNLFDQLGEQGRERYFVRLKESSAWPTMDHRSVLGKIIKLYPELERLMAAKASDKSEPVAKRGLVTSIRAYQERQLLYRRIKTVDIPNNSKEIAVARAHGDLRENFEYQAAKDAQGLLMRRQAELEQMLGQVVPTEFENAPTDRVGVGTGVRIEHADGRLEQYYILGVWDRDEDLGIISCESRMAQALEGCEPGEEVVFPTEHGETQGRVVEVTGLPAEVLQWIRDIPETQAEPV